jgi:hypothetical protein
MQTLSISDIQRNLHKLDDFDIVKIIDRKRNKTKGYFISDKYHGYVEELAHTNELDRTKKLKALESLGTYGLGGEDIRDIKASMYDPS